MNTQELRGHAEEGVCFKETNKTKKCDNKWGLKGELCMFSTL